MVSYVSTNQLLDSSTARYVAISSPSSLDVFCVQRVRSLSQKGKKINVLWKLVYVRPVTMKNDRIYKRKIYLLCEKKAKGEDIRHAV